jgi:hypothetical protein
MLRPQCVRSRSPCLRPRTIASLWCSNYRSSIELARLTLVLLRAANRYMAAFMSDTFEGLNGSK